jgi:hypothetical protein
MTCCTTPITPPRSRGEDLMIAMMESTSAYWCHVA